MTPAKPINSTRRVKMSYYYNESSSVSLIKDQMTVLRIKQQQQQNSSLRSQPKMKPVTRKFHVVYYLSRSGQLEHPHFMEVVLSTSDLKHFQLKRCDGEADCSARLRHACTLRMVLQKEPQDEYLVENDLILPAEGADEYVLKGSELVRGGTDKVEALQIIKPKSLDFHPLAKQSSSRVPSADAKKMEEEENEGNSSYGFRTNRHLLNARLAFPLTTSISQREEADSISPPSVSTFSLDKAIKHY